MSQDEYLNRIVDKNSLAEYLKSELGPVSGSNYKLKRFSGGHSNETLFIKWGNYDLVLRRPPPGETAESAHDVLREYSVMDALQNTEVRVPTTVLACEDHSVIGSDFYLMEREEGDVLRETEPERFAAPEHRRQIGEQLVDRLTEIHAVDHEAAGLSDFGRPKGFLNRQVDRWHKQFEWALDFTAEEREIPKIDAVWEWLANNVPDSYPNTLVHGDYKLDNVIFGPYDQPEVVGLVDWEMSTLGDPRTDLAWLLTYWRDTKNNECAIPELVPMYTECEGYLTKAEIVDRYETATSITFEHGRFYRALSVYKLGAVCEMFFRRHLEGNADNPMYPKMRKRVPALADWAMRIIEGEEPL